ncbi:MAG TPA: hypothetical protein DEB09_03440 [Candidatus Magasanikbacteria bacterium]|nr:hypothetical protein [Candidatus Magasanikbacteria bacterium]
MYKNKYAILIIIPAILIAGFALYVRILQYEPLFPSLKEIEAQEDKLKTNIIPIYKEDPVVGNKKAKNQIIMFEDFGCEACEYQMELLKELLVKHPDSLNIIWKGLSVSTFPYSTEMAHAYAYCANEQNKFSQFKDQAFANFDNLSTDTLNNISKTIALNETKTSQCITSNQWKLYMNKNTALAQLLNIQSVPTIFINNVQTKNPQTLEEWEAILNL